MHCPKCKNENLKPTKLEEGLPVMGCPKCEGGLLSLLYYRDWAERVSFDGSAVYGMNVRSMIELSALKKPLERLTRKRQ